MRSLKKIFVVVFWIASMFFYSCKQEQKYTTAYTDTLPSWNEGKTKKVILNFVEEVTDSKSENYVAIKDRLAVFDNDGNLWSGKPAYFQAFFALHRMKIRAAQYPEWKSKQPYKAVLENDMDALPNLENKESIRL